MAKIIRKNMKIFGEVAPANQIAEFGSLAAGSPAFSTDPEDIQSLGNYLGGWSSAILGSNSPALEDMNALHYLFAYQLSYLFQSGTAEWNTDTTYYIGSLVSVLGVQYVSITDDNIGNDPTSDEDNWSPYSTDSTGVGKDYWGPTAPRGYVFADGKTIGSATSGATSRAHTDTLALYTLLWNNYSNTLLPIQDSSGVATTRGASASADFSANKRLPLVDKRGRISAGKDDMGGSAASRLTSTTMTPDGVTLGASGGAQTHTLTTAELATHTHVQNAHSHAITDPGHFHSSGWYGPRPSDGGVNVFATNDSGYPTVNTGSKVTGISINNQTATNQNQGSNTPHNNVQPTIVCNYILKL